MTEKTDFLQTTAIADIECRHNQSLRDYSTWRIGGTVKSLFLPKNEKELAFLLKKAAVAGIALPIIGQGSNILFSDEGLEQAVCLKLMQQISWQGDTVYVQAGVPLGALVGQCAQREWRDLNFAAGIPGSVGGAAAMNAGCFGKEISENIVSIEALNNLGERFSLKREECGFAYRTSRFLKGDLVIAGVSLKLKEKDDRESIFSQLEEFRQRRLKTQPYEYPNCGSVFKNPPNESAGRLIEQAGLKGYRIGDAQISEKHANFIVNLGQARASEVLALIKYVKKIIWEKYRIILEPEVKFMGFTDNQLK